MKRLILAVLLCACLLLTSCGSTVTAAGVPGAVSTMVPGVDTIVPEAEDTAPLRTQTEAVLWFRFGTEAALAPEIRTISRVPSQTYEAALIECLLAGPSAGATGLNGLFPEGTRVLSTVKQGRTLFVTLSANVLNGYSDEPADLRADDYWRVEAPLRRKLCMQSLVATVTENCDVDRVQVLVQQESTVGSSLRLKQSYFLDETDESVLTGPLTRDPSLLLGPDRAMELILTCWSGREWGRLYPWIMNRDPVSGDARGSQRDISALFDAMPAIVSWQTDGCTLSADRLCATFAVSFKVLNADGTTAEYADRIVRLYCDNGIWKTSVDALAGWLEVTP